MLWRISEDVSAQYSDIDPSDLFSSAYEQLCVDKGTFGDPPAGMGEYMEDVCRAIARNIRAEQLRVTSQYTYRVQDVSEIMETVFDREDWPSGYTPGDANTFERDRMAPLEVRMDCCYGYQQLPEGLREVLIKRYYDKIVPPDSSPRGEALRYALVRLTEEMNKYHG